MPKDSSPRSEAQSQQEISLVFAYYDNPQMLALQWNKISQYESRVQDRIEVIIVDDASPHSAAAEVMRPAPLPHVSIYRVAKDIRWNQDAARNIGAHEARSRWLLLTDIDHVVPAETLSALIDMEKDPSVFLYFLAESSSMGVESENLTRTATSCRRSCTGPSGAMTKILLGYMEKISCFAKERSKNQGKWLSPVFPLLGWGQR